MKKIETNINVIFFIGAFFPKPTGATYSSIRLANALRTKGVNVSYVVSNKYNETEKLDEYDGFPVFYFELQSPGKIKKVINLIRLTIFLGLNRKYYDIYHIHGGGHVNIFLGWWLKLLGKKTILKVTLDGWDTPDGFTNVKWGSIQKYCYKKICGIVAMTSGQANKIIAWGFNGHLRVIPNGVDTVKYKPSSVKDQIEFKLKYKLPENSILLCYAGYLGKVKGTDILIQIWSKLNIKHDNIYLFLLGDYLNEKSLNDIVRPIFDEKRLIVPDLYENRIFHIGHINNLEYYLRNCDIFIFPSRQEGFGTVQIEAMACGLPCVVNDLPGVSIDIIPNEDYGFRIKNNDVDEYIKIVSYLINNPEERKKIGKNSRHRVEKYFSLENISEKYVNFYRELLK